MGLANMVVFNDYLNSSVSETIKQQVDLWNAATNNALILNAGDNEGDFSHSAMYKSIAGLVGNRNAYGTGNLTAVQLEQLQKTSVKVGGGTKPVEWTDTQFNWVQKSPEEAGIVLGEQMAAGIFQYQLNTAIAALVNAIGEESELLHDGTAGSASLASLNSGAAKFGDRAGDLAAWIMHSKSLHDIYGTALANSERLFQFGNVRVLDDGFGRPLVMTDSPALVNTTPEPDNYYQLGLVSGAAMIENNGNVTSDVQTETKKDNITRTWKAEFDFNVGLKGYTWDTTNGGKSPNDTALATGTNWDKTASDKKDTAGVRIATQ